MAGKILDRKIAGDKLAVGEYVMYFLENNSFCNQLMNDWMQEQSSNGFLEAFTKGHFNEAPQTKNIVPYFMNLVFNEVSRIKDSNQAEFKRILDIINKCDGIHLEKSYQLTLKYGLDPEEMKKDYHGWLDKMDDENDKAVSMFSMFAGIIIRSEVIILSQVYENWYKETYVFTATDNLR